jgi:hypothetical protein
MPRYIDIGCCKSGRTVTKQNIERRIDFYNKVLSGLRVTTFVIEKIPEQKELRHFTVAEAEHTISGITISPYIAVRILYNREYGAPECFKYDLEKLAEIYIKYNIPWSEPSEECACEE